MTSAESRFAASSKLDDVRVELSKKTFTTVRPRSAGSFFTSRSSERSNWRASARRRSTSSRVRSAIEMRWRRRGSFGGRSSSLRTSGRISPKSALLGRLEQEDAVDLVDLHELDVDALAARARQVLADVVGADRKLAVATVDEARELDAGRPAELEERLD